MSDSNEAPDPSLGSTAPRRGDVSLLQAREQRIPKIVHQLWKTKKIPRRWYRAVESIQYFHEGWEHRLWTDEKMDEHVRTRHPDLCPVFQSFPKQIMRVDVFRYVLMNDFGGLYCDLDYEFVRPYDYRGANVVLSWEFARKFGCNRDQIANYVFASIAGHPLWRDILDNVISNPPKIDSYINIPTVTGPELVTRVYLANHERYSGVRLTEKPVFSPIRLHWRSEKKVYANSGVTIGFHHGWGTWKERWHSAYWRHKLGKLAIMHAFKRMARFRK